MPTKKAKKVAKKVVRKATSPKPVKPKAEFKLMVSLNGEVFKCETSDLKAALLALAPRMFKTKLVVSVSNKFSTVERVLMIQRAKLLWVNKMAMEVFVKNLKLGLKNE